MLAAGAASTGTAGAVPPLQTRPLCGASRRVGSHRIGQRIEARARQGQALRARLRRGLDPITAGGAREAANSQQPAAKEGRPAPIARARVVNTASRKFLLDPGGEPARKSAKCLMRQRKSAWSTTLDVGSC